MSKHAKNRVRVMAVRMGWALMATLFETAGALAASQTHTHTPPMKCITTGSGLCVVFDQGDVVGKPYTLQNESKPRASILGVEGISVFDTATPVVLSLVKEPTECTTSSPVVPKNKEGDTLIVAENGGQYMYLISKDQVLKRDLHEAWRTDADGNKAVVWLLAEHQDGEADPYDYFVEFWQKSGANDPKKYFRVEAFPHLASDAVPSGCDCERPDVEHPAQPGHGRPCKPQGKGTFFEPSTGGGNEPGHGN